MKFVEGEEENGDQDHDKDEESDSKDNGMVSINILQTNGHYLCPIATGSSHAQLTMPMSVMKMMTAKEKKAMKALALMSG